jgi:hypothetical protein
MSTDAIAVETRIPNHGVPLRGEPSAVNRREVP